ncbi:hypothetical protein T8K17_19015 [Thalassobaculum sp. OXR-137]|uniref:hypothetical protein n=1 Tax=Thalassobaculum sp. OXR-137 TaxID=3100173 RepID=UPI002AC9B9E4|nr:hypothetical protein [Thalassobaculum sp. OXR-137]WPZ33317.1 hypothetical protein T8K17_19015 [Thalassobaculum sp. OXR-137]
MRHSFLALTCSIAALASALLLADTKPATAACAIGQNHFRYHNGEDQWPATSSAAAVRTAYANATCTLASTVHQTGAACRGGMGNNHITVDVNGVRYHVFGYAVANNNARYCTTTVINNQVVVVNN